MTPKTDELIEAYKDEFMKPDIIFTDWTIIESQYGDSEVVMTEDFDPGDWPGFTIEETTKAYGARLSASGYMDCTEFSLFRTELEAVEYLIEMQG